MTILIQHGRAFGEKHPSFYIEVNGKSHDKLALREVHPLLKSMLPGRDVKQINSMLIEAVGKGEYAEA